MSTLREASSASWSASTTPTVEQINAGSLQRIADATEVVAKGYIALRDRADFYERRWREEKDSNENLVRRINSLRGVITRMKKARGAKNET